MAGWPRRRSRGRRATVSRTSTSGCAATADRRDGGRRETAVRGVRRRDPRPEHRLAERREGAWRPCARRAACRTRALAGLPARRSWRRSSGPSGCYNVKAQRLAAFVDFLGREYGGPRRGDGGARSAGVLRAQLLAVAGSAARPPTRSPSTPRASRCSSSTPTRGACSRRLGLIRGDESYDALQRFFMSELPADAALFNDYHAQIVPLGQGHLPPPPALRPLSARFDLCPKVGVDRRDPVSRRCFVRLCLFSRVVCVSVAVLQPLPPRPTSGRTGATARRR